MRPGSEAAATPNHGTTTALLPIRLNPDRGYSNGAIVMAGGQHETTLEHSIDIYDPMTDQWLPSIEMGIGRHHPSNPNIGRHRPRYSSPGPQECDQAIERDLRVGLTVDRGATRCTFSSARACGTARSAASATSTRPTGRVIAPRSRPPSRSRARPGGRCRNGVCWRSIPMSASCLPLSSSAII